MKPIEYIHCEFCEGRTDTWHGVTTTHHRFYRCVKVLIPEGYRGMMEATEYCTLLDQAICPKVKEESTSKEDA
tara:strand:- start:693 stop:911 length:219 start_codon:yes stop_codon:yes gene_type:complete